MKNFTLIMIVTFAFLFVYAVYCATVTEANNDKETIWSQCYNYAIENNLDYSYDIWTCVHWKVVFEQHGIDLPTWLAYQFPMISDSIYAGQQ